MTGKTHKRFLAILLAAAMAASVWALPATANSNVGEDLQASYTDLPASSTETPEDPSAIEGLPEEPAPTEEPVVTEEPDAPEIGSPADPEPEDLPSQDDQDDEPEPPAQEDPLEQELAPAEEQEGPAQGWLGTSAHTDLLRSGAPVSIESASALRSAINALSDGDTITLQIDEAFTITTTISISNVSDVTVNLVAGAADTLYAAAGYRHLRIVESQNVTLNLIGLTLTRDEDAADTENSGGISINSSTAVLNGTNASIEGLHYESSGAMYINKGSTVKLNGFTFYQNTNDRDGSAIRVSDSTLIATGAAFIENEVHHDGTGGGTVFLNYSNGIFKDCLFEGNYVRRGGAVRISTSEEDEDEPEGSSHSPDPLSMVMDGCQVINNTAERSGGGVSIIHNAPMALSVTIKGSTFSGNTTQNSNGGALYFQPADYSTLSVDISDTTFTGNSAPRGNGGAISLNSSSSGWPRLAVTGPVTFSGNSAKLYVDVLSDSHAKTQAVQVPAQFINSLSEVNGTPLENVYNNYDISYTNSTFTVVYDTGTDAVITDGTVYGSGSRIAEPEAPTREGHGFTGWYATRSGAPVAWNFSSMTTSSNYAVNGVITLTAEWSTNTYEVSFDTAGADDANSGEYIVQEVYYNTTATEPATPTRFGYEFTGWYTAGGAKYDFSTPVTQGVALTARWAETPFYVVDEATLRRAMSASRQTIDIVFMNDIEVVQTIEARVSSPQFQGFGTVNINISTHEGKPMRLTMAGDGSNRHLQVLYGENSTYELVMSLDNITIDSENGYGGLLVKNGSRFTLTGTNNSGFANITANQNGGAIEVDEASTFTAKDLTISGSNAANLGGAIYVGGGSTATFEGIHLTGNTAGGNGGGIAVRGASRVTYTGGSVTGNHASIGGGASISRDSLVATAATGAPMVDGTIFENNTANYFVSQLSTTQEGEVRSAIRNITGWSSAPPLSSETPHNNYDIGYADGYYTLTYNTNGGEGTLPVDREHYGTDGKAIAIVAGQGDLKGANRYYEFMGWNTQPDGTGTMLQEDDELPMTGSITLYAIWVRPTLTVTLDANNGFFEGGVTELKYNVTAGETLAVPDVEHDSEFFQGWYLDTEGNTPVDFTDPIEEDFTAYALWGDIPQEYNYVIILHTDGGVPQDSIFAKFNEYTTIPDVEKTGYTFAGWYTDETLSTPAATPLYISEGDPHLTADRAYHIWSGYTPNNYTITVQEPPTTEGHITLANAGGTLKGEKNDGATTYTVTYEDDLTITATPAPGYDFTGWSISMGSLQGTSSRNPYTYSHITSDVTVSASFTLQSYTITIMDGDGDPYIQDTYNYGDPIGALPDLSTEAIDHTGWRYGPDAGDDEWDPTDTITGPATLYPILEVKKYTITIDPNNGDEVDHLKVDYGSLLPALEEPANPGYTFSGWLVNGGSLWHQYSDRVFGDTTLIALWGTIDAATPSRPDIDSGFEAGGADKITDADGNLIGYRVRKGDTLRVTFDEAALSSIRQEDSSSFTYTWFLTNQSGLVNTRTLSTSEVLEFSSMETGSHYVHLRVTHKDEAATGEKTAAATSTPLRIEVYAETYTVEYYDTLQEQSAATYTVEYLEAAPTPANPQAEGYTFLGWYEDAEGLIAWDQNTPITGNKRLYTGWHQNAPTEYTVHFEAEGVYVPDQIVTAGHYVERPVDPDKTGYSFDGWFRDSSFTQEYQFDQPVNSSFKLYAAFSRLHYTVNFQPGHGATVEGQTVAHGELLEAPENPTADGYTFLGWYKDAMLTAQWNFEVDTVTAHITLHGSWNEEKPGEHTVHFITDGGSAVADQTVVSGGTVDPPTTTRENHEFLYWYRTGGDDSIPFDLTTTITADISLTAKWRAYTMEADASLEVLLSAGTETTYIVEMGAELELLLEAVVTDPANTAAAALTYQWYSRPNAARSGFAPIDGAVAGSYNPSTNDAGTAEYYAEVTYTNPAYGEAATLSTNSPLITVTVKAAPEEEDDDDQDDGDGTENNGENDGDGDDEEGGSQDTATLDVKDLTEGDGTLSGTGTPGSSVAVTWPGGATSTTTVGAAGGWSVAVPEGVAAGSTVTVTLTTPGGSTSSATLQVKAREQADDDNETADPGPGNTTSGDPDTGDRSLFLLYTILAVVALIALIATATLRRRQRGK